MNKRIKVLCDYGVTIDFVANCPDGIEELGDELATSGEARSSKRYAMCSDALGNQIAICKDKIVTVLMEKLTDEEEEELAMKICMGNQS